MTNKTPVTTPSDVDREAAAAIRLDADYHHEVREDIATAIAAARAEAEQEAARLREAAWALADLWDSQANGYPAEGEHAAAAVRLCARELRAAHAAARPADAAEHCPRHDGNGHLSLPCTCASNETPT